MKTLTDITGYLSKFTELGKNSSLKQTFYENPSGQKEGGKEGREKLLITEIRNAAGITTVAAERGTHDASIRVRLVAEI